MTTEDEFDPLPADMMRRRAAAKMWGSRGQAWARETQRALAAYVPNQEWSFRDEPKPDLGAIRDLAQLARIGGDEYRRRWDSGITGDALDDDARRLTLLRYDDRRLTRTTLLPEAAFDWPIYKLATTRLRKEAAESESELRAAHGDR